MMAHINTKGQHINLWMIGSSPALGWGYTSDSSLMTGANMEWNILVAD